MGVRSNHYVVLGVMKPYPKGKEDLYDKYDKAGYLDSSWKPRKKGFVVLMDGMNGEFMIAGHVLMATGNDESGEQFFEPTVIEPTKAEVDAVRKDLLEKMGIDAEPKVILLTHFR